MSMPTKMIASSSSAPILFPGQGLSPVKFLNCYGPTLTASCQPSELQHWLTAPKCLMIMHAIPIIKKIHTITENLHTRYIDAIIMAGQMDTYYLDIAWAVDPVTLALWEGKVKAAEDTRMMDLTVMDVYAVCFPDYQVREPVSASASAPIHQWMEFALLVKETQ